MWSRLALLQDRLGRRKGPVCADDALVAGNRQQNT
jgi:hypothetical protein